LGKGEVLLPHALAAKYPNAPKEWAWQYVFPAAGFSTDPRSGAVRRHHVDDKRMQRAVKLATASDWVNVAGRTQPCPVCDKRRFTSCPESAKPPWVRLKIQSIQ
jgi:hypothetical protein